jgi:hypothetical protein
MVSGADRIIRAALHIRHVGLRDFLVLIGAVIVVYVVITRRGPGGTAGERLLNVTYRVRIRRRRRRSRPAEPAAPAGPVDPTPAESQEAASR